MAICVFRLSIFSLYHKHVFGSNFLYIDPYLLSIINKTWSLQKISQNAHLPACQSGWARAHTALCTQWQNIHPSSDWNIYEDFYYCIKYLLIYYNLKDLYYRLSESLRVSYDRGSQRFSWVKIGLIMFFRTVFPLHICFFDGGMFPLTWGWFLSLLVFGSHNTVCVSKCSTNSLL